MAVVKTTLVIAAPLCAVALLMVAVGYALPVAHVASQTATFPRAPQRVFDALVDVESYPKWRSDVKRVEVVSQGPPKRWRESGSDDITFETVEVEPPTRLVVRIADENLPFGGAWTYELVPEGGGTRLTITERGEVYNPVFRFMSRFVFGHTATIEKFLGDLKKHLA